MNIVNHLSTAASLYSGVYAQGYAKFIYLQAFHLFFDGDKFLAHEEAHA